MVAENRIGAIAALADPLRRRLYRLTVRAPLGRDEAADAMGIPRSTAAFHLDRLAEAGLVTVSYRRLTGRSGPGAGRPSKLYAAASVDVVGSVPERHYEIAGGLLASAIERADAEARPIREVLADEAHETGTEIGAAHVPLETALERCGYEPADDGEGGLRLENCPFHALARDHTDLVCGANVAFVRGLAEGAGDAREAVLEPREGRCCVAVRAVAHHAEQG
ncbi:helix-turn-helix domain-containing protein [Microbacterium sp. 4R-513]|uniref:helix-turn-helix transcriptional regulator n=1 Tax=Microbacterium sp. 4R-513 TaxID=2567934 RepID=UPI0013E1BC87|nr:helix-turn-helix domain-containing protein [Microbacterium sp. 4R-513]QIG40018.1 helix-turn-helix domain-containing protein [Microbacterium sp. 4R-513]